MCGVSWEPSSEAAGGSLPELVNAGITGRWWLGLSGPCSPPGGQGVHDGGGGAGGVHLVMQTQAPQSAVVTPVLCNTHSRWKHSNNSLWFLLTSYSCCTLPAQLPAQLWAAALLLRPHLHWPMGWPGHMATVTQGTRGRPGCTHTPQHCLYQVHRTPTGPSKSHSKAQGPGLEKPPEATAGAHPTCP